jgi:hypothetical protein
LAEQKKAVTLEGRKRPLITANGNSNFFPATKSFMGGQSSASTKALF